MKRRRSAAEIFAPLCEQCHAREAIDRDRDGVMRCSWCARGAAESCEICGRAAPCWICEAEPANDNALYF